MNSNNYYLFIIHVNEQNKSKLIFMFVTAMANCRLYWTGSNTLQLFTIFIIAYSKTKCVAGYKER